MPTRKDTWGKVLAEAGLAGIPLITSDQCGAAGYLVQDGINGFVVSTLSPRSLEEAMLRLLDADLRSEMGTKSKGIVEEFLNPGAEISGFRAAIAKAMRVSGPESTSSENTDS